MLTRLERGTCYKWSRGVISRHQVGVRHQSLLARGACHRAGRLERRRLPSLARTGHGYLDPWHGARGARSQMGGQEGPAEMARLDGFRPEFRGHTSCLHLATRLHRWIPAWVVAVSPKTG